MREYANVHDLLQKRRAAALASGLEGPRTMVELLGQTLLSNSMSLLPSSCVSNIPSIPYKAGLKSTSVHAQTQASHNCWLQVLGQTDVGKSTLCKILLNYAIRKDCAPTMIDLDPGELGA